MKIPLFTFGDIARYLKGQNVKFEDAMETQIMIKMGEKVIIPIEIKCVKEGGANILSINCKNG